MNDWKSFDTTEPPIGVLLEIRHTARDLHVIRSLEADYKENIPSGCEWRTPTGETGEKVARFVAARDEFIAYGEAVSAELEKLARNMDGLARYFIGTSDVPNIALCRLNGETLDITAYCGPGVLGKMAIALARESQNHHGGSREVVPEVKH